VIREENRVGYNDVKGMKEESGGRKVDQFRDLCVRERTLYLILLFILSQWRDLRIGVI